MCSSELEKFYSLKEMLNYITTDHQDVVGMRTICHIKNLSNLNNLKILHHPHLFNSFNKPAELQQVEEVKYLIEHD